MGDWWRGCVCHASGDLWGEYANRLGGRPRWQIPGTGGISEVTGVEEDGPLSPAGEGRGEPSRPEELSCGPGAARPGPGGPAPAPRPGVAIPAQGWRESPGGRRGGCALCCLPPWPVQASQPHLPAAAWKPAAGAAWRPSPCLVLEGTLRRSGQGGRSLGARARGCGGRPAHPACPGLCPLPCALGRAGGRHSPAGSGLGLSTTCPVPESEVRKTGVNTRRWHSARPPPRPRGPRLVEPWLRSVRCGAGTRAMPWAALGTGCEVHSAAPSGSADQAAGGGAVSPGHCPPGAVVSWKRPVRRGPCGGRE